MISGTLFASATREIYQLYWASVIDLWCELVSVSQLVRDFCLFTF